MMAGSKFKTTIEFAPLIYRETLLLMELNKNMLCMLMDRFNAKSSIIFRCTVDVRIKVELNESCMSKTIYALLCCARQLSLKTLGMS